MYMYINLPINPHQSTSIRQSIHINPHQSVNQSASIRINPSINPSIMRSQEISWDLAAIIILKRSLQIDLNFSHIIVVYRHQVNIWAVKQASQQVWMMLRLKSLSFLMVCINIYTCRSTVEIYQSAVNPQSIRSQSAVNPQSIRGQSAVNPRSIRHQSVINQSSISHCLSGKSQGIL
jgi:hypothetical protein